MHSAYIYTYVSKDTHAYSHASLATYSQTYTHDCCPAYVHTWQHIKYINMYLQLIHICLQTYLIPEFCILKISKISVVLEMVKYRILELCILVGKQARVCIYVYTFLVEMKERNRL